MGCAGMYSAYFAQTSMNLPWIVGVLVGLGMGLLIGIEFDESVLASGLREELFRNGFLVSSIGKSVIRIAPPLIITKSQALSFVRALDSLLSTRMGGKPNPIFSAFKNIGRKETPAMKALAEEKPAEEAKPAALPEPEDELD